MSEKTRQQVLHIHACIRIIRCDRILFKEKITNVMDYKKCDELKEEVMALKQERRQLEEEARALRKSNSQSQWYYRRKEMLKSSIVILRVSLLPLFAVKYLLLMVILQVVH